MGRARAIWEIRPDIALTAIDLMRRPTRRRRRRCATPRRWSSAIASLPTSGEQLRRRRRRPLAGFEAALRSAQLFLSGRVRPEPNCIMVVHEMRMALRELRPAPHGAGRDPQRGAGLHADQRRAAKTTSARRPKLFHDLLANRWQRFKALFDLEPPFVVVDPCRRRSAPSPTA